MTKIEKELLLKLTEQVIALSNTRLWKAKADYGLGWMQEDFEVEEEDIAKIKNLAREIQT